MNSQRVCPLNVLGPGTVCTDGIPEKESPVYGEVGKLVCRSWQEACNPAECNDGCMRYDGEGGPDKECIGYTGFCKIVEGLMSEW